MTVSADVALDVQEENCAWYHLTANACAVLRHGCCADCTHYDAPIDTELLVDEVAVQRAIAGDRSVNLNRRETNEAGAS